MKLKPSPMFWKVLKGVYSDHHEWIRVCIEAKQAGWTLGQVECMLYIFHPIGILVIGLSLFMIGAVVFS